MNAQRSLSDQLRDVLIMATEAGLYDAVDWIRAAIDRGRS